MGNDRKAPGGALLTDLILEVFRLNGRLLAAGDRLTATVGLTSARWQVLGAIHYADAPQTVSWLARSMGLSRQAVQRLVNELAAEGVVELQDNPAHRRAPLVTLTRAGRAAYDAVDARQRPWANALAKGLDRTALSSALDVLATLRARLESAEAED